MISKLEFHLTADPFSRDVTRQLGTGRGMTRIGSIQWHPEQGKRFVVYREFSSFSLEELVEITAKLSEVARP